MRSLEELIQNNSFQDPDDIDSLLEAAEITRQLISCGLESELCRLIKYTVKNGCFEAFSRIMSILQEEFEQPEGTGMMDFSCELGRSIPHYNEFTRFLQVDFNVIGNDVEKAFDDHGEVRSFFNISKYRTAYNNIFLVTEENFDLEDNDFILYKLEFMRDNRNK
jgi:hypothetical protein